MTREVAVNRETERLATILTPANLIERRVYTVYPLEAAAWAAEQGIPAPPTEYDTIRRVPARVGGAAVVSPEAWSVVSGQWSVVGSADVYKRQASGSASSCRKRSVTLSWMISDCETTSAG